MRKPIAPLAAPALALPLWRAWTDRVSGWMRASPDATRAVDDFADLLAHARDLGEIRMSLVELAAKASGAARVELLRARTGRYAGPLAVWPARGEAPPPVPNWTEPRDKSDDRPGATTLRLDLRSAGEILATLHLTPADGRPWPPKAVRVLETLCSLAASAERGLGTPARVAGVATGREGTLRGEPALEAFLDFALAQARRRREPVAVLAIAVDRLAAIRSLLGDAHAEEAVDRVARAVRQTLRASDVVIRLDGGRLMAILPTAGADDAEQVAGTVREAVAAAGQATEAMPTLTATIGVASHPDHASDVSSLRAAACSALTLALGRGHNRVGVHAGASALAS